ncbi:MAG TPA: hypothetical protein VFU43_19665 [Streptosporangiaceae bacterium]|nr:hypothetical protein [Streptosporangiaceae bacterium]
MRIDQRHSFFFQVPAVRVHPTVLSSLGFPEFTLVNIAMPGSHRRCTAWMVGGDGDWDGCVTPWHRAAQLSSAAWRDLVGAGAPRSGESVEIEVPVFRLPVRPARVERLLAGNELGLHRDDATELGAGDWAFVNWGGVPGIFRVRTSSDARDRGVVRLSYQARMLLGVPERRHGLLPEVLLGPAAAYGRPPLIGEPRFEGPGSGSWRRALRLPGSVLETCARGLLRAPEVALRTADAKPGEDRSMVVRISAELFPLLGTTAGQQVFVTWGPRCQAIATALAEPDTTRQGRWARTDVIGPVGQSVDQVPFFALVRVGAETRAALGIPRMAVVTIRRRVTSLILGKLNELILPTTGLLIALAVNVKLQMWKLAIATVVVFALLIIPLRLRRNPRGRVR